MLLAYAVSTAAATSRIKDLANSRGYPTEPTDRIWARRRPQWHRRHAQQHTFHQAVAAGDAGTAWRQYSRPADPHRQRRGRHGHRQLAGIFDTGHPHRRDRLGHGRCEEPRRRHPSGHPAARRRRQRSTCGRAGFARHRRLSGRRRSRQGDARCADRLLDACRTAPSSNAEIDFALDSARPPRLALRNPGLHHSKAYCGRDQRLHGRPGRRTARSLRPCN